MSRTGQPLAPHVQAAIQRAAAPPGPAQGTAQPRGPASRSQGNAQPPAAHVQAALAWTHQPGPGRVQPKQPGGPPAPAPHVQAAIQSALAPAAQPKAGDGEGSSAGGEAQPAAAAALHAVTEFVTYVDLKAPGTPPPPPRRPVYALSCPDGATCRIQDVKTGRMRDAGDLFGGFVRMEKGGKVYVSPRATVGAPGDSHPTIASGTPEWQGGKHSVVAAGEVGILDGQIVGHSDKTGHFQTRKNLRQAGMPPDKYHPFTVDPKEWYHR